MYRFILLHILSHYWKQFNNFLKILLLYQLFFSYTSLQANALMCQVQKKKNYIMFCMTAFYCCDAVKLYCSFAVMLCYVLLHLSFDSLLQFSFVLFCCSQSEGRVRCVSIPPAVLSSTKLYCLSLPNSCTLSSSAFIWDQNHASIEVSPI